MSSEGLNARVGRGGCDGPCTLTLELASALTPPPTHTQCVQGWSGLAVGHSLCGGQMKGLEGDG